RSPFGNIRDVTWSPDGMWVAYTFPSAGTRDLWCGPSRIKVANVVTGAVHDVSREVLSDRSPAWDPNGDFIFFASSRSFKPTWDGVKKDMGFVYASSLFAIPLRADVSSPFAQEGKPLVKKSREQKQEEMSEASGHEVSIDFDGILDRLFPFPDF